MQAQTPEVSGEKATTAADMRLVSVQQLQKIYRDLDACQKVIWLAGCRPRVPSGFDPSYVTDAQERLKEIEIMLATQHPEPRPGSACTHDLAHWSASMKDTWPVEFEEPEGAWMVGSIDRDYNEPKGFYPVITVDADQYDAPGDSEKIAKAISSLWQQAFSKGGEA